MSSGMIVLYDGLCGFCDRTVQFILKRDRGDKFRFAAIQSDFAAEVLARHGESNEELSTLFLVLDPGGPGERLLSRSRAAMRILQELGGIWWVLSGLRVLPTFLLDRGYNLVAGNRYRFGRLEACRLPSPEEKAKFLS
jgi:predicted DCC family thiol-disulfide oxidoreductase YuxK